MRDGLHSQTKLIQFALDILNHLCLEDLAFLENLLHRHPGNDDTGLTLDNALDNILNMISACRRCLPACLVLRSSSQNLGILLECFRLVFRADGEHSWQLELELFNRHSLQGDLEVEGTDGYSVAFLPWVDPGFLYYLHIGDTTASDDEVGVCVGDLIPHSESWMPSGCLSSLIWGHNSKESQRSDISSNHKGC